MPGASPKQVDLPAPLGSTWKSSFHGSGWSNLPLGAPQTYPNCWAQKDCVRTQQDPLLFAHNSRRIKFLTPVLCCSRSSSIFFAARWSKSLPSAAAGKKGCGENRAMTFHHLPPQKQRAVYNPKSQLSPENMSIGAQFARAVHDQVWPLWLTKLSPNHCTSTEPSSCPWCPYLIVLMLKEIFFFTRTDAGQGLRVYHVTLRRMFGIFSGCSESACGKSFFPTFEGWISGSWRLGSE